MKNIKLRTVARIQRMWATMVAMIAVFASWAVALWNTAQGGDSWYTSLVIGLMVAVLLLHLAMESEYGNMFRRFRKTAKELAHS